MKLYRCVAWVAVILFATAPAQADLIIADPPYHDVDKDEPWSGGVDSDMCWAAAVANVMMSTGWGVDYDGDGVVEAKEDIYKEFQDHFTNAPGYGYKAFEYYLQTHYPALSWTNHAHHVFDDAEVIHAMANTFQTGFPVYMAVTGRHVDGWSLNHAITGWGFDLSPDGTGTMYITDNEDWYHRGVYGLQAFPLFSEGTGANRQWFMRWDGIDHVLIARLLIIDALPAPPTWLLVLVGLAALGPRMRPRRGASAV